MYIDFHTHRQRHQDERDVIEIISVHPGRHSAIGLYTAGYHPWWVDGNIDSESLAVLEKNLIEDTHCLGVGECGLDSLKGPDPEIQEKAFILQLHLANSLGAPVIIHCVRAFDRILRLRKTYGKTDWVIHGFRRNRTLAAQLIDAGFYLSLSPFAGMPQTFTDMVKYCPDDRIFLETDSDPDMDIKEVYSLAAQIRNVSHETLKADIFNNFQVFFKWKQASLPGWKEQNC
ncbi:MAG: TatD family hydrolase [Saprospiraceae bacterium]|nr:TatD family hydrolase [Saprospiraceae bacterium]